MKTIRTAIILFALLTGISFTLSAQLENNRPEKPVKEMNKPLPPEGIQQPTPPPPPPVLPGIPNLSKEQNEGIRKLQISLGQNILPIENEIREKDARLNTLTTLKDPDMKSIYALMDEIGVLKIKIAKMQMAHDMDIRKILNDEQRLIFDKRPKHPIH
jgi:hypothetical protein